MTIIWEVVTVKDFALLLIIVSSCLAQQVKISEDLIRSTDGEWMRYNNGTPNWATWDNQYRGTWFNIEDFIPGSCGMDIEETEIWFYHGTEHPWDTSETLIEYWNGDILGPFEWVQTVQVTGVHYAPTHIDHSPDWVSTDVDFWVVQNTELSSGGWPSLLSDGSDWSVTHSWVSDDFITWAPWIDPYGGKGQFFIQVIMEYPWSHGADFSAITWGGLKSVF